MPWTRKQVKYLFSSGSPLSGKQKAKMHAELHADPAMGHMKKGSKALKKSNFESESHSYNFRNHLGGRRKKRA